MKVLLIEPPKPLAAIGGEDVFIYEPLALEYLAAGIPDHQVQILDLRLDDDLISTLEAFSPDIVGITAYTIHVNVVKGLFQKIKKWNKDTLTVVGGHHATILPEDFVTESIDVIVSGEGVSAFSEIINRHNQGESFQGIPGVSLVQEARLIYSEPQIVIEIDDLPNPNRELTKEYRSQYHSEWMKPLASIRTSKGCPYRCSFCALWKIAGGRYFTRTPEKVVEELSQINEEWVFFADDESLLDVNRMIKLALLIKNTGIKKQYFLYSRSDTITKYPDLIRTWREIGLERVFVGFEFVSDSDLEYIHKKSTTQDNIQAIKILHDLGIQVYASFILRPEFTKDDFRSLRRFCRQQELSFASYAVLTPLPGTDLYDQVESDLILHNYDYFDFIHTLLPTKLPMKEFYKEYHDLYFKGIKPAKQIEFLSKYPVKELPRTLLNSRKFYQRLKNTYLDYEDLPIK